ncbi:hypothetical protein ACFFLM_02335 [Deinococcus oregonensis]|uniref:Uncharacterized protein n=1 Tax=Deinococcus oregonensis TaxID=1805970 RepID=A0ABV6ATJ8_9DEIO
MLESLKYGLYAAGFVVWFALWLMMYGLTSKARFQHPPLGGSWPRSPSKREGDELH